MNGGVAVMRLSVGRVVNNANASCYCLRLFWRIMTAMENQISLDEPTITTTASLHVGGPAASAAAAASNSTAAAAEEAKSAKPATRPAKVMSVLSSLRCWSLSYLLRHHPSVPSWASLSFVAASMRTFSLLQVFER